MHFHKYFVNFDGDFGAFDESGSYHFVPYRRPPFFLFSKRPGRLKGRIRYSAEFLSHDAAHIKTGK